MCVVKKIWKRLKGPWPYGFNPRRGSEAGKRAWRTLSIRERLMISCHNPFRGQREAMIFELSNRGLPQSIIVELSGISKASVSRIVLREKVKSEQ